ncbi:GNAT family N-acetyltransferase [Rhodobacteraceae bacterium MCCB 386]|nr:GNAT family N-acetyltransferase [Roseitranquillus sediminis]
MRLSDGPADVRRAQRLRHVAFIDAVGNASRPDRLDRDPLDALCRHMLVESRRGRLLCTCRLLPLRDGREIDRSHAARHYDLSALAHYDRPMIEVARFCVRPGLRNADVLRVAWNFLARYVEEQDAAMLFGCSSFRGADPERHVGALALLRDRHQGPACWTPGAKAPQVQRFADLPPSKPDPRRTAGAVPPLLRAYLAFGGWVGDHAVIDRDLDTLHVFTAVEVRAVPERRARFLRREAGG